MKRAQKVIVVLAALVALGFIAVQFLKSPGNAFDATTYDNGKGTKFSVKFYPGGKAVPLSSLTSLPSQTADNGLQAIKSPNFDDDGVAMVLYAFATTGADNGCQELAFSLNIAGSSQKVCAIKGTKSSEPLIYYTHFTSNDKPYTAFLMLDYDNQKAKATVENAQRIVPKLDLRRYRTEAETILGSLDVE